MSKKIRHAIIFCLSVVIVLSCFFASNRRKDMMAAQVTTASSTVSPPQKQKETPPSPTIAPSDYNPVNKKNETIYVSLNPYGGVKDTKVVNGYHIKGPSIITDYGNYSDITNLTNFEEPTVKGDQVTWKLDGQDTNFYYQGNIDPITLPWNITLRYKLNGVETKAEDLAGASGMIETIIDVKPNDNVSEYLGNNFFLQISTTYDMGKNLSVEAEDGIVVSLGDTKSVTYMTLPGEEATYHIRVGSMQFENNGLNFVMAPLKASILDEVHRLKDTKERVEDAGDAIYDNLNTIVDSTSAIQNGLSSFAKGLTSMKKSISAIEAEGNANDAAIDELTEQSNKLNESLKVLIPHLDTSQQFIMDVYDATNTVVTSLTDLKEQLITLDNYTQTFQDDLDALKKSLDKIDNASDDVSDGLSELKKQADTVKMDIDNMMNSMNYCVDRLDHAQTTFSSLPTLLQNLLGLFAPSNPALGMLDPNAISPFINSANGAIDGISSLISTSNSALYNVNDIVDDLYSLGSDLQRLSSAISSGSDTLSDAMDNVSDSLDIVSDMNRQSTTIIDCLKNLQGTFNTYEPEFLTNLTDMKIFMTQSSELLQSATNLTDQVHDSVKKTKGNAYKSLQSSLDGALATIYDTIDALSTNDELKKNNQIIHDTIHNEWDRLEDEYNLLDYDKDAKPVSLVSSKNEQIDSIQIVLNTPEIVMDKKEAEAALIAEEHSTLLERIKNIFNKIFE